MPLMPDFTPFKRHLRPALAALLLGLAVSPSSSAEEPSGINVIEFVTHVNASRGVVRCGLFRQKGWLKDPVAPAATRVNGKTAVCVFRNVAEGVYGISAFHDENENGKIDTNFVGMPTEDYCASRNARGTFGPPSFADAKFKYNGGRKRLEARMK